MIRRNKEGLIIEIDIEDAINIIDKIFKEKSPQIKEGKVVLLNEEPLNDLEIASVRCVNEIQRLNNKLLKIKELINRTPRQTSKEKAYIMLKCEIAEVIGTDK